MKIKKTFSKLLKNDIDFSPARINENMLLGKIKQLEETQQTLLKELEELRKVKTRIIIQKVNNLKNIEAMGEINHRQVDEIRQLNLIIDKKDNEIADLKIKLNLLKINKMI